MIFFFYGDDAFTASKKIAGIRDKFIREVDPSGANVSRYDGAEVTVGDLAGSLSAMPLFVRKRLIIVTNVFASRKGDVYPWLIEHVTKTPDSTILVLHADDSATELKKSLKGDKATLFATLAKQKLAEELVAPKGSALARHYQALALENSVTLVPDALNFLMAEIGGDLHRAENEIKKCAAYTTNGTIDLNAAREIITTSSEANFFGMIDAVANRDKLTAIRELEKQFEEGSDAVPIVLRTASQIRLMLSVYEHVTKRTPAVALIRIVGAPPFVIEKACLLYTSDAADDM
jgi:DNA polymerase III delta subunit